jgi:hypothetical protein
MGCNFAILRTLQRILGCEVNLAGNFGRDARVY